MKNILIPLLILVPLTLTAAEGMSEKQIANRKTVKELNSKRPALLEGQADYLVLPGLIANKKEQKVTVLAEATGIEEKAIAEFFIIGEGSGHDYESISIAFASAGDIRKAMEFIGMTPGRCVQFQAKQFWPKGERVTIQVSKHGSTNKPVRLEKFMIDKRTGKTLPETGFAFTGSVVMEKDGVELLSADDHEPNSFVSNYNEPQTLFDIPYQGSQDAMYDSLHPNADMLLPTNTLLEIIIEPEYKDGTKRVCDLTLNIADGTKSVSITNHMFSVLEGAETLLNKDKALKSALEVFSDKNKAGKDVYVTLTFSDDFPLGHAAQICQLLHSLEAKGLIRIEPPPEGQLYYRAFTPNPAHLDREKRSGHPWELHLSKNKDAVTGQLTQCSFVWNENNSDRPTVAATDFDVATPTELRDAVAKYNDERKAKDKSPNIPVVLVVAPTDMTFGEMIDFVSPSMDLLPIVHVYAMDEAPTAP